MMLGGSIAYGGFHYYDNYLKKDNYEPKLDPKTRSPKPEADLINKSGFRTPYSPTSEFIIDSRKGMMNIPSGGTSKLTTVQALQEKLNDGALRSGEAAIFILDLPESSGI